MSTKEELNEDWADTVQTLESLREVIVKQRTKWRAMTAKQINPLNTDEKSEDTYQVQYTVHPGRLAWTCDCPADTCRKRCCHIDQCIDLFRAGLAGGTVAHPFNVQPPKAA